MTLFSSKQFRIFILGIAIIITSTITYNKFKNYSNNQERLEYETYLNNHPFTSRLGFDYKDIKSKINKKDRPDLAWQQDFLRTINPKTKKVERKKLYPLFDSQTKAMKFANTTPGSATYPWVERGPLKVGGRTRAIAFDPTTTNKVWAGSVNGGLWFNNDITNSSSQWQRVNDFWSNISISSIAFDPNNAQIIYVGTGEGFNVSDSKGAGLWKSTDGGSTWNQLGSTTDYAYVQDLIVRNETGTSVIYAAVGQYSYQGQWFGSSQGLFRSTDGGNNWTEVMPSAGSDNHVPADLELDGDNNIWVGTRANSFGEGGGKVMSSSNGTTWTTRTSIGGAGRVKIACSPSDGDYIYALFESGSQAEAIRQITNASTGNTWVNKTEPDDDDTGIAATDFTRGQAWYDLAMAVDPNNPTTLLIGGIDVFKSPDGAGSWNQISHWWGGYGHQYVHADIHQIVYKPGSSTEFLIGCDGGVFYSSTGNNATPTISERNQRYNVTQFYAGDINPTASSNYFLAGSQDNGTQKFTLAGLANTTEATGGDGGYCFIDQTDANIQITSYVYNSWYVSTDGGNNFTEFDSDQSTGSFINPADYDNNQNILYSARTSSSIKRYSNINSGAGGISSTSLSISLGSMASNIKVSPHTTGSSTLFIGTQSGRLFKVTNANATPSTTEITGSLPTGNISSIDIGSTEQEIMVTFSNYGLTSVWYTANGGGTWVSKEGDLPDMPVRWCLFNPNNYEEVLLATEVGVWSTSSFITSGSPSWVASNSGLANVRVDMLQTRTSDNEVMAATYGRGLFSGTFNTGYNVNFVADQTNIPQGTTVNFSDLSTASTTSWAWTISPATGWAYAGGTNANSQNPQITFNDIGSYTITLDGNDGGSNNDTEVKTNYIVVSAPSYCDATTTDCDEYITNVTLNTINQNSACENYNDKTAVSTDLTISTSYNLSTTLNTVYSGDEIAAYIDWNQDSDFDDPGERIINNTAPTTNNTDNFTVPANATLGPTRMRVRLNYGAVAPCGTTQYGEVEDYSINVVAPTFITLTNSPSNITIECDESTDPSNTGQLTATTNCSNTTVTVNYNDVESQGSCTNEKVITRTWSATNTCDNSEQHIQTITIQDNTAPIVNCTSNKTLGSSNGVDANLPNYAANSTASDNCDNSLTIMQSPSPGTTLNLGTHTVMISATDDCGNIGTCEITVEIIDDGSVAVDELTDLKNTSLFPNPTSGDFFINSNLNGVSAKVYSSTGNLVFDSSTENNFSNKISTDNLANGLYYVKIIRNDTFIVKPISILK